MKPTVCVLLGDASGVGAEILTKAFAEGKHLTDEAKILFIGDRRVLTRAEAITGCKVACKTVTREELKDAQGDMLFLDSGNVDPEKAPFAVPSAYCGKAVIEDIGTAMDLCAQGYADGICFAPFNKEGMRKERPDIASELEIFQENCDRLGLIVDKEMGEINVVDGLWTTRVTSHIPMVQLGKHLTYDGILSMIRLANRSCKAAGIEKPRVAVAALNPHCGEGGLCGDEEQTMIKPAMEQARKEGICVTGLYSGDTVFVHAFRGEADVVVTMYHDQGQIALKLKGFSRAVTLSAGFPMPIGTPAHGTAHDIAGTGVVSESAFETAFHIIAKQSLTAKQNRIS